MNLAGWCSTWSERGFQIALRIAPKRTSYLEKLVIMVFPESVIWKLIYLVRVDGLIAVESVEVVAKAIPWCLIECAKSVYRWYPE
jgi:hypothetical protein